MLPPVLLPLPLEVGKSKFFFIQRKGNCPLCRVDIRKIHYKKKLLEPEYLKFFDIESEVEEDYEESEEQRVTPPRRVPAPRPFHFFLMPIVIPVSVPQLFPLNFIYSMENMRQEVAQ